MPKKKPIKGKPKVNKELEGLEIKINEFGQIITNYDVRDINRFLNRNVDDKKLRDREDISQEGEFTNVNPEDQAEDEDNLDMDIDEEFENARKRKGAGEDVEEDDEEETD